MLPAARLSKLPAVSSSGLSLACAVTLWLAGSGAVLAACTPTTSPTILQNGTVTCSGATTNQNGPQGFGTGFETGLTINVLTGASVTGTNNGIYAAGATVNNDGAIVGTGGSGVGVSQLVLNNTGSIIGRTGVGGFDVTVTNSGTITATVNYGVTGLTASVVNSGTIQGPNGVTGGTVSVVNTGSVLATLYAVRGSTGDAALVNSGTIRGGDGSVQALNTVTVTNSGTISGNSNTVFANIVDVTNSGLIEARNAAAWAIVANSKITLSNTGTVTGGVQGAPQANLINSGSITGNFAGVYVGILTLNNSGTISGHTGIIADGLGAGYGTSIVNSGAITGATVAIQLTGSGNTLTLAPGSVISGTVQAGGTDTFQLGGAGAATFDISKFGGAAQYQGFSTFNKVGTSVWTLTGTSTFAGPIDVNGGTLAVNGDLSSVGSVNANHGGTLSGVGTVMDVAVNSGGALAPGNAVAGSSLNIAGNLAFASGAIYLVQINASASFANVTGVATLGGATVNANFAAGSYAPKQFRILHADGAVSGTFATGVVSNVSNFQTALSYGTNDVYLSLALNYNLSGALNGNQQAVGNALTSYFNGNNGLPVVLAQLSPAGLTQASGELGSASQQATFAAMGQFMSLLTDPAIGSDRSPGSAAGAIGFAAESDEAHRYAADRRSDAFAMFDKAPSRAAFVPGWSTWASGFGGSQTTRGNSTVGSNDTTSRIFAGAVGADYRFSPETLAGFALAGGGTGFGVDGLGSGRSDLFQVGAYVRHVAQASYVSAALAYGWQHVTTDRTIVVAGGDRLHAEFNANAYSGRVEGGHRVVAPWMNGLGVTPYGAVQLAAITLPAYAETVLAGVGAFALAYAAKAVSDTRSELGLRTDKSFAMSDGVLTLRGRLAWAHDFNPDRSIAATFQALPGASFVVNGAAQATDSALVTAAAEKTWQNGWTAIATFEGEFSSVTRSVAGKGVVRYAW
ncbi:autotransporter domain-containing protein [Bradyrhizobium liaoningense]|uniref:autotransporter outer membrane beta-barrel domain-containing protein n=1 Tax=Bradyrhizobium liaoningense TaxID=43992 RepID=UPI001BA8FE4D|nr:autotransporter domain-containing protein [Bradyrhizobium liaoningense]MBR0713803.1 autotransporter domain-containing protein [Bradyrhizobium liaoningense]